MKYSQVGDINRYAPFGTHDSPLQRTKLIGGRMRTVFEDRIPTRPAKALSSSGIPADPPDIRQKTPALPGYTSVADCPLSRHPVLPPITNATSYVPTGGQKRHYPERNGMLPFVPSVPTHPVVLSKSQENTLKRSIREDIRNVDYQQLKNLYFQLANYDLKLTGHVPYDTLKEILTQAKFQFRSENIQLLAAVFLSSTNQGQVNYEKLLSFVSTALKENVDVAMDTEYYEDTNATAQQYYVAKNGADNGPITGQSRSVNNVEMENARLRVIIADALLNADRPIDMGHVQDVFRRADADHRGRFSGEQIRRLVVACRLPLQESIISQMLDSCDNYNGQYSWEQFLGILERVQPQATGLPIPPSRRPLDIAKKVPEPSQDWPRAQGNTVIPDSKMNSSEAEDDIASLLRQHNWRQDIPSVVKQNVMRQRDSLPQGDVQLAPNYTTAASSAVGLSPREMQPYGMKLSPRVASPRRTADLDLRRIDNELNRLRQEYEQNLHRQRNALSQGDAVKQQTSREVVPSSPRRLNDPPLQQHSVAPSRLTDHRDLVPPTSRELVPYANNATSTDTTAPVSSRDKDIEQIESELKRLRQDFELLSEQKAVVNQMKANSVLQKPLNQVTKSTEPWDDRFLKLAKAMYINDVKNSGYLSNVEVRWLTTAYNQVYDLNISDSEVDTALARVSSDGYAPLDSLLTVLRTNHQ